MSDKLIDESLSVSSVSSFDVVLEFAGTEPSSRVAKLEWPKEVAGLLKVGANAEDLMDKIFNRDDTILTKRGFDQGIVGERDALLVDFPIATLVNQLADALEVGFTISDIWFDDTQHLRSGFGELDEDLGFLCEQ